MIKAKTNHIKHTPNLGMETAIQTFLGEPTIHRKITIIHLPREAGPSQGLSVRGTMPSFSHPPSGHGSYSLKVGVQKIWSDTFLVNLT